MTNTIIATNETIHNLVIDAVIAGVDAFAHHGTAVNLNHIDVSNVTSLDWVFPGLAVMVDVSSWDTSNVTNLANLLCDAQVSPDLSNWNVSSVRNMDEAFARMRYTGNLSSWNVHSECSTRETLAGANLHFANGVGELHWICRADVLLPSSNVETYDSKLRTGGAVGQLSAEEDAKFMQYSTMVRKLHTDMGSDLHGPELGRAAWAAYQADLHGVESAELPEDFDFN